MVIGFEIHAARGNKLSTLNIYGKKGGREGGGRAGPGPVKGRGPAVSPALRAVATRHRRGAAE